MGRKSEDNLQLELVAKGRRWEQVQINPRRVAKCKTKIPQVIKVSNITFRSTYFLDFDWKAFDTECKRIVAEISDKFIELGLDEQASDYDNDMATKQENLQKELSKKPFNF